VCEEKLDLFELTTSLMVQSGTCPAQVLSGQPCQTAADGSPFTIDQITFGVKPFPHTLPALLMGRNNGPDVITASAAHASMDLFTQSGIGTVRM